MFWLMLVFISYANPIKWISYSWMPIGTSTIEFILDSSSWPFLFSIAALLVAFLLHETTVIQDVDQSKVWGGILALCGIASLGVTASSPLAVTLAWTGFDLVEVLMRILVAKEKNNPQELIKYFSMRIIGTFLFVIPSLVQAADGSSSRLPNYQNWGMLSISLAVIIRTSLFPFKEEKVIPESLDAVLLLTNCALGLALISKSAGTIELKGSILIIIFALAIISFLVSWHAKNPIESIKILRGWSASFIFLAIICSLLGVRNAVISMGVAMLSCGSILVFYSFRRIQISLFLLLGYLTISALPYTPLIISLTALSSKSIFWVLLIIPTLTMLQFGFLKNLFRPGERLDSLDQWIKVTLITSIVIPVITVWIIFFRVNNLKMLVNYLGFPMVILAVLAFLVDKDIIRTNFSRKISQSLNAKMNIVNSEQITTRVSDISNRAFRVFENLVDNITGILEGAGGILWALLLLILLISAIQANISP